MLLNVSEIALNLKKFYLNPTLELHEFVLSKITFKLKLCIEVWCIAFSYKAPHRTELMVCRDSFPFFNIKNLFSLGWSFFLSEIWWTC